MFIRNKRFKKFLAVFFLLTLVYELGFPVAAYALTAGPTAPEATSFEPVDTTDMVNLQTGDFTYNIPLLEVPGPEGGYPLSLSYHAGIQPNEDASWVGLGWSLNPGAINRSVSGFPDDWTGITQVKRDYWEGVSRTTYSIGVSVGIGGTPATVSFGLSFSNDTQKGFGVGVDAGMGVQYGPLSVGTSFGSDGYGEMSGDANVTAFRMAKVGMGLDGAYASASLSIAGVGITLSTKGGTSFNFNAGGGGGYGYIHNSKAGKIQTESDAFGFSIPIGYFAINLGYAYSRVWSDETESVTTYGSLYTSDGMPGGNYDQKTFDSYSLLDHPAYTIARFNDPTVLLGGSYPDFDNYNVLAQGMSGVIRPYFFKGHLLAQNRKTESGSYTIKYNTFSNATNPAPHFRFINDFSNSYRQDNTRDFDFSSFNAPFDPNPVYGNADGTTGYNTATNHLAGSKHIEYFTNAAIAAGSAPGFIKADAAIKGFGRSLDSQIGGFSITNESGVTYHYGLPAYSKNEYIYTEKIDKTKGDGNSGLWNKQTKPTQYAYTWYLTSITGPDFVDRDGNGVANSGDWGYWVDFDYGKWTDSYIWRNPSEGFHRDVDNNFQSYSKGEKELYYLNSIRTRTHTVLFEKDSRLDGKCEASSVMSGNNGAFDNTSKSTMRLDRIYILNSSDAASVSPATANNYSGHLGANMIDKYDITGALRTQVEGAAVKIIDFTYDYSLTPGTVNSFDPGSPTVKSGKLTLKSLTTKGRGAAMMVPPTYFDYELPANEVASNSVFLSSNSFLSRYGSFQVGDLIMAEGNPAVYCGVVTSKTYRPNDVLAYSYTLTNGKFTGSGSTVIYTTKNAPYDKDAYDTWGMFKADFDKSSTDNENLRRTTTPASARSSDAWSLRTVTSPLGAKTTVRYEPDSYSLNVLNGNASLLVSNISVDQTNHRMTFTLNTMSYPISSWFQVGDNIDMLLYRECPYFKKNPYPPGMGCEDAPIPDPFKEVIGGRGDGNLQIWPVLAIDEANKRVTIGYDPTVLYFGYVDQSESCYTIYYPVPDAGNLFCSNERETFGGGLRVKSIGVTDVTGNITSRTLYTYNKPGGSTLSSGTTPYEPIVLDIPAVNDPLYKQVLYQDVNHMLTVSRELPPPGVLYEYVTVNNEVEQFNSFPSAKPGYSVYQFEVFNKNMIDLIGLTSRNGSVGGKNTNTKTLTIKNYTSRLGNLKRVVNYDNTGKKLTETINQYLHTGIEDLPIGSFASQYNTKLGTISNQGVVMERYAQLKEYYQTATPDNMAIMSGREEYPMVQTGQTSIDYKTGAITKEENISFDFYSGAVTGRVSTDAYGNRMLTEVVPAYRKYGEMGLKVGNGSNKHMLTQEAEKYVYKINTSNGKVGIVSASVQTWSDGTPARLPDNSGSTVVQSGGTSADGNVWRKQAAYIWMPAGTKVDGITPLGEFADFNFATPSASPAVWKKASETTLYDVYSHSLEEGDINNNYAAVKMGYNDSRVLITGTAARYKELAFCGAEDVPDASGRFSGGVLAGSGTVQQSSMFPVTTAHTGYNSLKVAAGLSGFSYSIPITTAEANRQFIASVWVKSSTTAVPVANIYYQVNSGGTQVPANVVATRKAGDWYQLNIVTPATAAVNGNTIIFGCKNAGTADVYFDDFRVRPLSSSSSAYAYDKQTGAVTYILDNNNLFTRFEYDAIGRLIRTYRETFGNGVFKTAETEYNFGAMQ